MGGESVARGIEILNSAGIPTFPYSDSAARAFSYMWQYSENLRALYEIPEEVAATTDRQTATSVLERARAEGRVLLTEQESKCLLAAYAIPVTRTEIAATEDEAVRLAAEIGFPVVSKLHSHTITHKTEVGGVELNLHDESDVRSAWKRIKSNVAARSSGGFEGVTVQPMIRLADAYELILGSTTDPQFGPVVLFGLGGQLVEVFRDRALGLPPLNSTLARRLMERTKIYKALAGVRGKRPVDRSLLEQIVVRFSLLVADLPRIKEADINPLLASPNGNTALDARIVLHDWQIRDQDLPRTAIRPYPSAYVKKWTARNGLSMTIRPIHPEDEPRMVHFHESLSDHSVYLRYFHHMDLSARVTHERLSRICFVDYDRAMVVVAEAPDGDIVAVGRLMRRPPSLEAEFALLVSDAWQGRSLGTELLRSLLSVARNEGIHRVFGQILGENRVMQQVCRRLGFETRYSIEDGAVDASIVLGSDSA
jgi:acetyltransferase